MHEGKCTNRDRDAVAERIRLKHAICDVLMVGTTTAALGCPDATGAIGVLHAMAAAPVTTSQTACVSQALLSVARERLDEAGRYKWVMGVLHSRVASYCAS